MTGRARGRLYGFRQLTGSADRTAGEALSALREEDALVPAELGERAIAEGAVTLRLAATGPVTVLRVSGVLDARCASELPEVLLSAARACPGGLVLDLRGVGECDEAGVAALGRACEYTRRAGYPVGLAVSTAELDQPEGGRSAPGRPHRS